MKLLQKSNKKLEEKSKNLLVKLTLLLSAASVATCLTACGSEPTQLTEDEFANNLINCYNRYNNESFTNPKFRSFNIVSNGNYEKTGTIHLLAEKNGIPYFIKVNCSGNWGGSLANAYNLHISSLSTIYEDPYAVNTQFEIMPTSAEVIEKMAELTNTPTKITYNQLFDNGYIQGYFYNAQTNQIEIHSATTWQCHISPNIETDFVSVAGSLNSPSSEGFTHKHKNIIKTEINLVDVPENLNGTINDFVLDFLNNMNGYEVYQEQSYICNSRVVTRLNKDLTYSLTTSTAKSHTL